jgi:stearoyl-CoA 9-desaturase NADPH oxidoreductase
VMSMLRTMVAEGHTGRIRFVHYARTSDDVIFADELARLGEAANVEVTVILTGDDQGRTAAHRGRIRREHLDALAPDRHLAETFVCGPVGLLDVVEEIYSDEGLADHLHTERYQARGGGGALTDEGGTLTFTSSDITVDSDGRSILEQAEDAGLNPDFGCRMGICHGCVQRKPAGAVRDVRSGDVCDEDGNDIQLCITVPLGDVEIDI